MTASNDHSFSTISVTYSLPELPNYSTDTYTITSDTSSLSGGTLFAVSDLKVVPKNGYTVSGVWANTDGYYPDVNAITFWPDSNTTYIHNGHTLTYTGDNLEIIKAPYKQEGARVYFIGITDDIQLLINYYGVLADNGNILYVGSANLQAHLPYVNNDSYGPWGTCPFLKKQ